MWTSKDGKGTKCAFSASEPFAPDMCRRLTRLMTLSLSDDGSALVSFLTPDPSVEHYMFIVKVIEESRGARAVECGECGEGGNPDFDNSLSRRRL